MLVELKRNPRGLLSKIKYPEKCHPSFRRPFHPHRLVLMSYPEALTYEEARGFADFIRERVLRYSEHENPELPRL